MVTYDEAASSLETKGYVDIAGIRYYLHGFIYYGRIVIVCTRLDEYGVCVDGTFHNWCRLADNSIWEGALAYCTVFVDMTPDFVKYCMDNKLTPEEIEALKTPPQRSYTVTRWSELIAMTPRLTDKVTYKGVVYTIIEIRTTGKDYRGVVHYLLTCSVNTRTYYLTESANDTIGIFTALEEAVAELEKFTPPPPPTPTYDYIVYSWVDIIKSGIVPGQTFLYAGTFYSDDTYYYDYTLYTMVRWGVEKQLMVATCPQCAKEKSVVYLVGLPDGSMGVFETLAAASQYVLCPAGYIMHPDGTCKPITAPSPEGCVRDADCPPDYICVHGVCQPPTYNLVWCEKEGKNIPASEWSEGRCKPSPAGEKWCVLEGKNIPIVEWSEERCVEKPWYQWFVVSKKAEGAIIEDVPNWAIVAGVAGLCVGVGIIVYAFGEEMIKWH